MHELTPAEIERIEANKRQAMARRAQLLVRQARPPVYNPDIRIFIEFVSAAAFDYGFETLRTGFLTEVEELHADFSLLAKQTGLDLEVRNAFDLMITSEKLSNPYTRPEDQELADEDWENESPQIRNGHQTPPTSPRTPKSMGTPLSSQGTPLSQASTRRQDFRWSGKTSEFERVRQILTNRYRKLYWLDWPPEEVARFFWQTTGPGRSAFRQGWVTPEMGQAEAQNLLASVDPETLEKLMPFQKEGLAFGIQKDGRLLLGDEMGLGKSLQALLIARYFQADWPLLIIIPASLRYSWRDQVNRWFPEVEVQVLIKSKETYLPKAQVYIVPYSLFCSPRAGHLRQSPSLSNFGTVIVDESHYCKEGKSQRTKFVTELCVRARRVILLSGTPMLNSAKELYTQLCMVHPQCFKSKYTFLERYCVKETNRFGTLFKGSRNVKELFAFLKHSCMIRRLKRDVLPELPEKIRERIELTTLDQKKYKEIKALMTEAHLELKRSLNASSPSASQNTGIMPRVFQLTAEAKLDGVKEYVDVLLEAGTKFLLFAHHHVMLDSLQKHLEVHGGNRAFVRIDGKTSIQEKADRVRNFQLDSNVRVALLSMTACGTGLTLTAASCVVFAELYWVPAQLLQCEDRIHRIGQGHSCVNIHYLIGRGTLDDAIYRFSSRIPRIQLGSSCCVASLHHCWLKHCVWRTRACVNIHTASRMSSIIF